MRLARHWVWGPRRPRSLRVVRSGKLKIFRLPMATQKALHRALPGTLLLLQRIHHPHSRQLRQGGLALIARHHDLRLELQGAGHMQRVQCAAPGGCRMRASQFLRPLPDRIPIQSLRLQNSGVHIVIESRQSRRRLLQAAFSPKGFETQRRDALRAVERSENQRLAASHHPNPDLIRSLLDGVEFEQNACVAIPRHDAPRLSSSNSSDPAPDQVTPQIFCARSLKSGNTGASCGMGTIRATGLRRRVTTNSAPASTFRTSAAKLCCASIIEQVFISHKFNA
jgi:hypothetical protein